MVGASPLPPAVRDGFEPHTGVRLLEGYGLTEATCASARSFPDAPRPGSVGQRLPYQQVRPSTSRRTGSGPTARRRGRRAGDQRPDRVPRLRHRPRRDGHVLDGLGKLRDGWLDTGDLGRVDDDGFVYLTGRAKDLIIRGGHNIDPAIIEDALLAHPAVTAARRSAAPTCTPARYRSPTSPSPPAPRDPEELRDCAADRVAERAAAPKAVTVLDPLPVTAVGKPYKLALRADATRRAVADALAGFPTSHRHRGAVGPAVLNQYALRWHLNVPATDSAPVSD